MKKLLPSVYRAVLILLAVYLLATVLLNVAVDKTLWKYFPPNLLTVPNTLLVVPALLLAALLLFLCCRQPRRPLTETRFYWGLAAVFALVFAAQLCLCRLLYFHTGWDVGVITGWARSLAFPAAELPCPDPGYFDRYPNNVFLLRLFTMLYRVGGALAPQDPYAPLLVTNCAAVSTGLLLAVLCVYRLTGNRRATWLAAGMGILLVGLSPWVLIPYSDTLGMPWPIAALYCLLAVKKTPLRYGLAVFFAGIGCLLKPTVGIFLLALALVKGCALLACRPPVRLVLRTAGAMAAAGLCVAALSLSAAAAVPLQREESAAFGVTHYLMMGLNTATEGVYAQEDVDFSSWFDTQESRTAANLRSIRLRLEVMRRDGLARLLVKKQLNNYNDGTFGWGREGSFFTYVPPSDAPVTLALRNWFFTDGAYFDSFAALMQVLWLALLLCSCGAALARSGQMTALAALTVLGLSAYLLLFECRARYLLLYTPFFLCLMGAGLAAVSDFIGKRQAAQKTSRFFG